MNKSSGTSLEILQFFMAFSANFRDKDGGGTNGASTTDSRHNPATKPSQADIFTKEVSTLTRQPFDIPDISIDGQDGWTNQSVFLESLQEHSLIIDCAQFDGLKFRDSSLLNSLRDQYPSAIGLQLRNMGKTQKFAEISFESDMECKAVLSKQFILEEKTIVASKTLDKNANIVRLGISNIPHKSDVYIQEQLMSTLVSYGDILNLGVYKTKEGKFFTGRAYATLNIDKRKTYAKALSPQIDYDGDKKLHLVYSGMKPICAQCHVDDHIRANCPKLLAKRKTCYRCSSLDHLVAQCPQSSWNRNKAPKAAGLRPFTFDSNGSVVPKVTDSLTTSLGDFIVPPRHGGTKRTRREVDTPAVTTSNSFAALAEQSATSSQESGPDRDTTANGRTTTIVKTKAKSKYDSSVQPNNSPAQAFDQDDNPVDANGELIVEGINNENDEVDVDRDSPGGTTVPSTNY